MKKLLLTFTAPVIFLSSVCSQNTGIGTNTPDASAMLDITSSSKGLLVPRMGTTAISLVSNPAKGLLVLDTATNQLMVNMGMAASPNWRSISFKSGWNLTGNAGINPATHFIGTTDLQPLQFRVNNLPAGQIDPVLHNTVFGYSTLASNTSGNGNTAIGDYSLYYNTIGSNNTVSGLYALYSNTTGSNNMAFGNYGMYANTTGSNNTAVGYQTLNYNTSGFSNAAIGLASLYANTTGYGNTGIGNYTLYLNTTGYSNAAYGLQSLYSNTTGANNTASGNYALYTNADGFGNTGYGYQSLYYNTNGSNNTAVGNAALFSNNTGSNNTTIGANTDMTMDNLNNATAIGASAISDADYKVVVGMPLPGIVVIGGYANWSNFSDGRFKENVHEDVPGLSFISKLRPVTYTINTKGLVNHITHLMPESKAKLYKKTDAEYAAMQPKRFTGFVAQEVEAAAKQMGYDFDGVNPPRNETDHYSLSYASFVVPLVKAVQEQQLIINSLQKQVETAKAGIPVQIGKQQQIIEQQNKKIDMLEKRLAAIEDKISK